MKVYGKVRPSNSEELDSMVKADIKEVETYILNRNDLELIDFLLDYGFKIVQMEMRENTLEYLKEENYNIPVVFHGTRRNKEIAKKLNCKKLVEILPKTDIWSREDKEKKADVTVEEVLKSAEEVGGYAFIDITHLWQTSAYEKSIEGIFPKTLRLSYNHFITSFDRLCYNYFITSFDSRVAEHCYANLRKLKGKTSGFPHFNDHLYVAEGISKMRNMPTSVHNSYDPQVEFDNEIYYANGFEGHLHIYQGDAFKRSLDLTLILQILEKELGLNGIVLETKDKTPELLKKDIEIINKATVI